MQEKDISLVIGSHNYPEYKLYQICFLSFSQWHLAEGFRYFRIHKDLSPESQESIVDAVSPFIRLIIHWGDMDYNKI